MKIERLELNQNKPAQDLRFLNQISASPATGTIGMPIPIQIPHDFRKNPMNLKNHTSNGVEKKLHTIPIEPAANAAHPNQT